MGGEKIKIWMQQKWDNQAIGLFPLLLFMLLDNYVSYQQALIIAIASCFFYFLLSRLFCKECHFHYLLIPSAITFVLYFSIIIVFRKNTVFAAYSPLFIELLLVVVLAFFGFMKHTVLHRIRSSEDVPYRRIWAHSRLNESFFIGLLIQNLYTLHLFVILIYGILTEDVHHTGAERFLYRDLPVLIGLLVIVYEQIRLWMMNDTLHKESWLPVLNDNGKVIGRIARSVSCSLPKKYFHPIVRVAVVYRGMLYLVNRKCDETVSPSKIDYPFSAYVLFRQSLDQAVENLLAPFNEGLPLDPRFLIRYTFENEKVKHSVNLYVVCIRSDDTMKRIKMSGGKLWTTKQIEENLGKEVFCDYFEHEFAYLQHTVLLAENFCCAAY